MNNIYLKVEYTEDGERFLKTEIPVDIAKTVNMNDFIKMLEDQWAKEMKRKTE